MYKIQKEPDGAVLLNGGYVTPLMTLKDKDEGIAHIIEDDHCMVLLTGSYKRPFKISSHWFPEAVLALILLKDDPEFDCTDVAHPAWWRGEKSGGEAVIGRINDVLTGKDEGAGVMGNPRLEKLRRYLLKQREGLKEIYARVEGFGQRLQENDRKILELVKQTQKIK